MQTTILKKNNKVLISNFFVFFFFKSIIKRYINNVNTDGMLMRTKNQPK